jgi:hypothetical protein
MIFSLARKQGPRQVIRQAICAHRTTTYLHIRTSVPFRGLRTPCARSRFRLPGLRSWGSGILVGTVLGSCIDTVLGREGGRKLCSNFSHGRGPPAPFLCNGSVVAGAQWHRGSGHGMCAPGLPRTVQGDFRLLKARKHPKKCRKRQMSTMDKEAKFWKKEPNWMKIGENLILHPWCG